MILNDTRTEVESGKEFQIVIGCFSMADDSEYRRIQRRSRFCGIALVVLVVTGVVYIAPLAVLTRSENPLGRKRFLSISPIIAVYDSPQPHSRPVKSLRGNPTTYSTVERIHKLNIPILETVYTPVLEAANKRNKFAKFILGVE